MPLPEIGERVRREFGAEARVAVIEEVRTAGLYGFFARRFLEVVVELPDPVSWTAAPVASTPAGAESWQAVASPAGGGLAALLADADEQEAGMGLGALGPRHRAAASSRAVPEMPPATALSTDSEPFARLLDDLTAHVLPEPLVIEGKLHVEPPSPLSGVGDLLIIMGLGSDALTVATGIAQTLPRAELCLGGQLDAPSARRVDDRRAALEARARAVESGRSVIVAYGLGNALGTAREATDAIRSLAADQLWLAVDASRKPEDTDAWATQIIAALPVQALAAVNTALTATPRTVQQLGLPQGWSDAVG